MDNIHQFINGSSLNIVQGTISGINQRLDRTVTFIDIRSDCILHNRMVYYATGVHEHSAELQQTIFPRHDSIIYLSLKFGNNTVEELNEISEEYKSLFNTLDIVPSMIEAIDSSNASSLIKDVTKNHLCRMKNSGPVIFTGLVVLVSRSLSLSRY